MKEDPILKYITNKPDFIKTLFEQGLQLSLADAQTNWEQLYPFSTPCPAAHWSFSDWRTSDNILFEKLCLSKLRLAHALSIKDKSSVPFYDLICIALSKGGKLAERKYFINEILKYTASEKIRDYFAEELYKVNKALNEYGYTPDSIPFIIGLDKLLKTDGKYFDLCRCGIRINQQGISKLTGGIMLEMVAEEEPYWSGYPTYKATLRFHNVKKFNYDTSDLVGGIVVKKSDFISELEIRGYGLQFDCDVFKIACERLEVVDYCISVEKDPCEGKSVLVTTIENNTTSEIKVKLFNQSIHHFEVYNGVKLSNETNPYILIPANRSLGICTEVDSDELSNYLSKSYNPLGMVEEFIINNSIFDPISISSIKYDIITNGRNFEPYKDGIEFIYEIPSQ